MEVRFSTDPLSLRRMTTEEIRKLFVIDSLFVPDHIPMVYSDIDRSIVGSAVPINGSLKLESSKKEMAAEYFAERREIGVINIGGEGTVSVDGKEYRMEHKDGLYIGRGSKEIIFSSSKRDVPAKYYFVSYPAHTEYPTTHITQAQAESQHLGSTATANDRTIYRYIHVRGVRSCQLVMGLTELAVGSVWNTMPPHTHQRRSEVYMYFNLDPDSIVVHFMGKPSETRHLILRNEQAVLSPIWSIHSGVGTKHYSFVWAMGGENQVFEDMDGFSMRELY
ncbi:MAG: 5-dehydro-4-deoxy-D-glucuronate isomerase [Bacteroidetes bacterium]|nr:5-dehydro-4-deoxy-D-glucuronate isomerase [Bacteroidota bacterium]